VASIDDFAASPVFKPEFGVFQPDLGFEASRIANKKSASIEALF